MSKQKGGAVVVISTGPLPCRYEQDIWLCNLDWKIKKLRGEKKTTKQMDEPLTSDAEEVRKHEENIDDPVVVTRKALPHKPGYPE